MIRRADRARALEISDAGIRWAGPTDPEPDAPIVACELPPLDHAVLSSMPIPSTLLRELAARLPIESTDPRWRRTARRPTERGVTRIGAVVIDPREDRAQVGIEVEHDFLALDGTYGGSTGQLSEVAIRVGDGVIATFVRCDLARGGTRWSRSIAERNATILLIDCRLPDVEWNLGDHCHLVILGGQIGNELSIHTAPTATVTVEGLVHRRVSRLSRISNAPRGIPFDVDGETYGWETDDRSGSSIYTGNDRGARFVHLTHQTRPTISFELPDRRSTTFGWWRSTLVTEQMVERAIRIAGRTGTTRLSADEVEEAFDGHGHTLPEVLVAARAMLDGLRRPEPDNTGEAFVRCLLEIGCRERTPETQIAVDDWVASSADDLRAARPALQHWCDCHVGNILHTRSAAEFLLEMCARMTVELGLDLQRLDRGVAPYRNRPSPRSIGVPAAHDWMGTLPPGTPVEAEEDDDDLPAQMR